MKEAETAEKKTFACDQALRQQVLLLLDHPEWSRNKIASKIGMSTSVVSQYLGQTEENGRMVDHGNTYPGDTARLEARLDDLLRNEARRRASGVQTKDCEVAGSIEKALEYIRKTNDVGMILAEAGEGKSRGLELYKEANPTAVLHTVRSWAKDAASIEGALFESVGKSGWDNRTKRAQFMATKLRGSDRLIIVDDAHKLTRPALQWLFDFFDETQCPMGLIGIFELEDKLADDAQRFSRVGLKWEIKPSEPAALVRHLVRSLAPDANGETGTLCDLLEQVAKQMGHYRSVHKHLKLAAEMKKPAMKWVDAVKSAHLLLVNNYQLT